MSDSLVPSLGPPILILVNDLLYPSVASELLAYVEALDARRIQQAFAVHGELEACESIARGLSKVGIKQVTIPESGQQVEI